MVWVAGLVLVRHLIYAFDSLKTKKANAKNPIPIMESAIVGVKTPESVTVGSRVAEAVAEDVAVFVGVAVGDAEAVDFGVAVGVAEELALAEGVDSKAGPSAA